MTPQPLVSCCCARVAYLLVSPCAFWMSVVKPASLKAFSSAGRSPFSHRLDEAASGRMTQARFWASPPEPEAEFPPPPLFDEHAARTRTLTVASAAKPEFLRFTDNHLRSQRGTRRRALHRNVVRALRHSRAADAVGGHGSVTTPRADVAGQRFGGTTESFELSAAGEELAERVLRRPRR